MPINHCIITMFLEDFLLITVQLIRRKRFCSCSKKDVRNIFKSFYFFLYIYVTTITIITSIIIQEKNSHQLESRRYLQKFARTIREKERQRKVLFTETEILVEYYFSPIHGACVHLPKLSPI